MLIRWDSYEGIAITPRAQFRDDMLEGLRAFRGQLVSTGGKPVVARPHQQAVCRTCRFGRPRVRGRWPARAGSPQKERTLYGVTARNGKLYHSPCGDAYQWLPPHADAERLQLFIA